MNLWRKKNNKFSPQDTDIFRLNTAKISLPILACYVEERAKTEGLCWSTIGNTPKKKFTVVANALKRFTIRLDWNGTCCPIGKKSLTATCVVKNFLTVDLWWITGIAIVVYQGGSFRVGSVARLSARGVHSRYILGYIQVKINEFWYG